LASVGEISVEIDWVVRSTTAIYRTLWLMYMYEEILPTCSSGCDGGEEMIGLQEVFKEVDHRMRQQHHVLTATPEVDPLLIVTSTTMSNSTRRPYEGPILPNDTANVRPAHSSFWYEPHRCFFESVRLIRDDNFAQFMIS
jgi:hypothetical protein